MQQSEQTSNNQPHPKSKTVGRLLRAALLVAGCVALLGGLIKGLIIVSHRLNINVSDPVQFVTGNLLNALVFIAIVAQVVIYRKQWDVMKRSTEVAERALIAGERAFVSFTIRWSANKDINTGNITRYTFTPVWSNSGNTPTRHMVNHTSLNIFSGALPNDWNFPDLWTEGLVIEERNPVPLGVTPKGIVDGQYVSIDMKSLRDVIDGDKQAFMWGWAEYNDVFPDTPRHITRFALRIVAGGRPLDPTLMSFKFVFLPTYNCSDEECEYQQYPAGWRGRSGTLAELFPRKSVTKE